MQRPDSEEVMGTPDRATVTETGEPLTQIIDGVRLHQPPVHVDHRGRVFEVFNQAHDFWTSPVVHSYVFTIRPYGIKGWGIHDHKEDRYCLLHGEMLVVLWDGRGESVTSGLTQEVLLSAQRTRLLQIPRGVWHADINMGPDECLVMNHPTEPYNYECPDRRLLPWDSAQIPVDLRRYLPAQWGSSSAPPGQGPLPESRPAT